MWRRDYRDEVSSCNDIDSFSICSLVRETLPVLERFVEHHQRAGVEHVFLFFDGTVDETRQIQDAFQDNDTVSITCCDSTFWTQIYPNKARIDLGDKQYAAFYRGIDLNTSDWLLFCDADEYVVADRPLGVALAKLPKSWSGVRLQNTEAVWGPKDNIHEDFGCSYERNSFPNGFRGRTLLPLLVYGRSWLLIRRGMTGYTTGKHLLRAGVVPEKMTSHFSRVNGKRVRFIPKRIQREFNLRIVHFDAIGFERWKAKWESRILGQAIPRTRSMARKRQWAKIAAAFETGAEAKLFRRINSLNRWQQFVLVQLGLLGRIEK